MSAPYRLTARAGDSFARVLTWTEDDGTPINLSTAMVEWAVKGWRGTFRWTAAPHASITNAAAGEVTLALAPADTRALASGSWAYEVTVEFASGVRTTILDGTLSVSEEVLP